MKHSELVAPKLTGSECTGRLKKLEKVEGFETYECLKCGAHFGIREKGHR